ncbi:hypothetical protein BDF20DRAFT_814037 [Mycotypha africana]|uniref:uncharacterized protein n=1 Tax=Mycotypha africana TaxID=64632 RepID=UPI002301A2C9|nr:uncharacterized protein BDF20DRAFT_814037 [Mycotypha africana]KAI8987571.1 hypothetical protein BDF20DRAFT_814037 [Mycotypha africana]
MAPEIDDLDTLSDAERTAYEAWWKDLNPFHVEKVNNETILQFVSGCCLPHHTLEEILLFFQQEKEGLTKGQCFAMLRLIAHVQNGRKVSPDMIYLGGRVKKQK